MAANFKVFLRRLGELSLAEKDLEEAFKGVRYKSITGVQEYGKPKVYTETYAESSEASVFLTGEFEQTDIVLTLYFFPASGTTDRDTAYSEIDKTYHDFMDYITGNVIVYRDTYRNRVVYMYLSDAVSVKTDSLYGQVYREVQFKFKNKYGKSFPYEPINYETQ